MSMERFWPSAGYGPYIGSLARRVWQWVRAEITAEVTAAGYTDLNPAHIGVFRNYTFLNPATIGASRGPSMDGLSPTQVAEHMEITKQSVNDLLGHLERHGYLKREPDPANGRWRVIRLTGRGRKLEAVIFEAARRAERDAGKLLGEERLAQARDALADLVTMLSEQQSGSPRQGQAVHAGRAEGGGLNMTDEGEWLWPPA